MVGGMLTLDLIAAFPFALIDLLVSSFERAWTTTRIVRAVRLVKLLRGVQLPLVTNALERHTKFNPGLLRVMRLLLILLIICHWCGCLWYFIGAVAQKDLYNLWTPTETLRGQPLGHKYLYSFYWAFGLLTGIAPTNVTPQTAIEAGFSIVTLMGGVCMSALVVSSATSAVANLDAYAETHQTELDAINGYLHFKRVPHDLRRRINNFHTYIWSSTQFIDQNSAIAGLPPQLRLQLLLALNLRCLAGVPIFKHCDTRVIIIVVQSMKSAVFCPDEFVVRAGTYGKALFLITRGTVHVLDKVGATSTVLATLSDNDFFGEMSLVTHEKTNASIRVAHYTDMNVLLRSDFLRIVELFPELAKVVSQIRDSLAMEKARKLNAASGNSVRKSGGSLWDRPKLRAVRIAASLDKKRACVERAVKGRCSTLSTLGCGGGGILTNGGGMQSLRRTTVRRSGEDANSGSGCLSRTHVTRDLSGGGGLGIAGVVAAAAAVAQEPTQPGSVLGHASLQSSGSSSSKGGSSTDPAIQEEEEEAHEGSQQQ